MAGNIFNDPTSVADTPVAQHGAALMRNRVSVRSRVAPAVCLVLARRGLIAKLQMPADWDGAGAAAVLLGKPAAARCNPNLEVYSTLIGFGNHDHPAATTP